jgi:acyl-CoA synthetase (AMP-forming)/AMP-acid ligase II
LEVSDSIREMLERNRLRPFLLDSQNHRSYTYGQVEGVAGSITAQLLGQGLSSGDRIGVLLENSVELALIYFACLFSGFTVVPMNPASSKREIDFIIRHSGIRLLAFSNSTRMLMNFERKGGSQISFLHIRAVGEPRIARGEIEMASWSLEEDTLDPPDGWLPFRGFSPERLMSITFTSGTTGTPKGVAHRAIRLLENARLFNSALGFDSNTRLMHLFPMSYMAGLLNSLLCPFMAEGSVVIGRMFDVRACFGFWDAVIQHGANTFWMNPTMIAALLKLDRDKAGIAYCKKNVRGICVGTAPLPLAVKKKFEEKYGVQLLESYGLSELLFVSSNSPHFPRIDGSVGRLLPGVKSRIGWAEEDPSKNDQELWIQTPYVMDGYVDLESFGVEKVGPEDWFPTGDMGRVDGNGNLFITGRIKDIIIRGGINISPRAIEEVLLEHPSISEAAVIGVPHEFYGEELVAAIIMKSGLEEEHELNSIRQFCRSRLNQNVIPKEYRVLAEFPVNSNGKVQKAQLRGWLTEQAAKDSG